jgi:hypothetical protein
MARYVKLSILMVISALAGGVGAAMALIYRGQQSAALWSVISPPVCTAFIEGKDIKFENPFAPIREWHVTSGAGVSEAQCMAVLEADREGFATIDKYYSQGKDIREEEDREVMRAAALALTPAVVCTDARPAKGETIILTEDRFSQCVPHDTVDRAKGEAYGK